MRVRLDLSYDGQNFIGFQRQPEGRTIQGEVEKVLSKIFNEQTNITGAGRTDAGVHALKQVVCFETNKNIELSKLRYSLNCLLPKDIHVDNALQVADDFHPRHNVLAKEYRYKLNMGEANPFYEHYRYELKQKLDLTAMMEAKEYFIGTHNFQNFTTKEEDNHEFIREIFNLELVTKENELTFVIVGTGFMRYMVRMIVGTLIAIGLGKEKSDFVLERLNEKSRKTVIYKAPPQGLYLTNITYQGEEQK